jgi:alanine racemase
MTQQQQRFTSAIAHLQAEHLLPPRLHLANTAATLVDPPCTTTWCGWGSGSMVFTPPPTCKGRSIYNR